MICSICGKEFDKSHYYEPFNDVCGSDCFGEKLWIMREKDYLNGKSYIIINGNLYSDGGYKKNEKSSYLGHGGREFNIKMKDGNVIFTNNLWHGGEIPENHREILCDNAIFV